MIDIHPAFYFILFLLTCLIAGGVLGAIFLCKEKNRFNPLSGEDDKNW